MTTLPNRTIWTEGDDTIIARGPIYKFDNREDDPIYGRSIEQLRERDRAGIIPQLALYAVADDMERP